MGLRLSIPAGEMPVGAGVERSGAGTLGSPSFTPKDVDPDCSPVALILF